MMNARRPCSAFSTCVQFRLACLCLGGRCSNHTSLADWIFSGLMTIPA